MIWSPKCWIPKIPRSNFWRKLKAVFWKTTRWLISRMGNAKMQDYKNSLSCPLNPTSKTAQTGFGFVKNPWGFDRIHHKTSKFWHFFGIMKKTSKNASSKKLPKFVFLWKMMKNHFQSSALALPLWNKKLLRICIPSKIQTRNWW